MQAIKELPDEYRVYVFIICTIIIGFILLLLINIPNKDKDKDNKVHVPSERIEKHVGLPRAMNSNKWQEFKLIEKEQLSHDSYRFRFELQSNNHVLGLPIGQHISLKFHDDINNKDIIRSYTPISSDDDYGYVDFIIKIYYSGINEKFPNGGAMSQYVANLNINNSILMKGPKGHLEYIENDYNGNNDGGIFTIKKLKKDLIIKKIKYLGKYISSG